MALVALAVAALAGHAAAQEKGPPWKVAPPPAWVADLRLPDRAGVHGKEATSGRVYLLLDHQVRVGVPTIEYNRQAWTIVSTEGVQDASEIQIDFDPTYQRLAIHHVRLLRNGRDVFSFRANDVRVIQQEADLDQRIYSGQLTAVVFLRDLRPGDTLDYAYSLEGANPILGGAYDDVLWLQYGSPVQLLRHRITLPAARPLHVARRNTALVPAETAGGGWRTYTWEARDVPADVSDEDEPSWFDPAPRVEISTFGSWGEVARWALALFESQDRRSPAITALADQWRHAPGGLSASAALAVRFVQDEVRYLGIELGPNSHQPHPPEQVLQQRFGDCKDKALLLVALLRELGVDAAPALVNTARREHVGENAPSAFAFDHAIVQANLAGRALWIDATESEKGGPIEDWDPPRFARALVLRPGADRLTIIEPREPSEPLVQVNETYTIGAERTPTRLDVLTTYRRGEADDMRRTLASTARSDLAKEYLDYYAREFSDIRPLGTPRSHDDREHNVVTVTESYEVKTFWKHGERELDAWQVRSSLPKTAASTRTSPLDVPHPVHVVHEVLLRAPRPFRLTGRKATIDAQAFAFSSSVAVEGTELRLSFAYRSRADSVGPEAIKAHQEAIGALKDELSLVLTSDLSEAGEGAGAVERIRIWLLGLLAGGALAAAARIGWRRVRRRRLRLGRRGAGEGQR